MKVPAAVNCAVVPSAMDVVAGETASEARAGAVTVRVVLPLTPEYAAVMVVEPGDLAVAMPVLETVAAPAFDELQVADLVRSLLLPSLYLPVALNCRPSPAATADMAGVTSMDCKTTGAVPPELELPPPQPTSRLRPMSAIDIEIW